MFKEAKSQIEGIQEIFESARTEEGWKVDDEMLYSFYFIDTDVDKLERLGLHLENEGYEFLDIFELGDEETNEPTGEYLLHIDKEEIHTPESLAERNVEFQRLADEYGVSYDGWEFGEVDGDEEDETED